MPNIQGIEAFRLNFTIESKEQVINTINMALGKLNGSITNSVFNQMTDTRGHFNKEIM